MLDCMTTRKRAALLASAAFTTMALACSIPAMAQDAAGSETAAVSATQADDNVIMVTAQLREQDLQDVPLAITAITGDMLEARNQTNLSEISAQTPNLILQENPSGRGVAMRAYIRGIGQYDQVPAVEPGVGIYLDEVYFGTITASALDLVDIERVEVLRGPQGTLAGMNSLGGAIKIFSRMPKGDGGYVEATLGTLGRLDVKASADFTIVPDAVYARVTGMTRNEDGHVDMLDYACLNPNDPDVQSGAIPNLATGTSCKVGELGNTDMYGLRGTVRIAPVGSPLEITIIGDYSKDRSSTQGSVLIASGERTGRDGLSLPYQGAAFDDRFVPYGEYRRADSVINDPYVSYANFYDPGYSFEPADAAGNPGKPNGPYLTPNASFVEGWGVSGTIDYELSDNLALKSITAYRTYDSLSGMDNDNSPIVYLAGHYIQNHEQFSQELRLSGSAFDGAVDYTLGGIYYDGETFAWNKNHTLFVSGDLNTPTATFIGINTATLTSYAGFANVAWRLSDALTLEGGIRATRVEKEFTFDYLNFDAKSVYLPQAVIDGSAGDYSDTVLDYRAVVSYEFTPDLMVYAQFATGFKGGGIAPRPYTVSQILPFGPEKLKSYEVGFKGDLFDRRLRLNGAAFYMDYIGYQGRPNLCVDANGDPLPEDDGGVYGLCGQYLNLADAKVKGFEVEAFLEPIDGLNIDASLSLTDFKFREPNYENREIVAGARLPEVGRWRWSIGAQYEINLGMAGTLTPRIDVHYTPGFCGERNFVCDPIGMTDSYTLANARLTFRTYDEDWSVSLEATNLFDKLYYINRFSNAWYTSAQIGRPAEYAVTVRRNF